MKLLLKLRVDWYYNNLSIIKKTRIIILDKYKQYRFQNIILAYYNLVENNN